MRSKLTALFLSFVLSCSLAASGAPSISLITCGAGGDLYAIFGHSGLRVVDPEKNTDIVYNYGIFSFEEESFLYKFVKGETYYWVGASSTGNFLWAYAADGRPVYESKLLLPDSAAIGLAAMLEENARPENKVYLYSYMYDNCATRIRDIVDASLGGSIIWRSGQYNEMPKGIHNSAFFSNFYSRPENFTYRDLLNIYLRDMPWVEWSIFFTVAAPSDRPIPYEHSMFLPEFLLMAFQNAYISQNGQLVPLAAPAQLLVQPDNPELASRGWMVPVVLFVVLFMAVSAAGYAEKRSGKRYWAIDFIMLLALGLWGAAGAFVSFISLHPATFPNYNMLWASPLHLVAAFIVLVPALRRLSLAIIYPALLLLFIVYIIVSLIGLQAFHPADFVLIAAFAKRLMLPEFYHRIDKLFNLAKKA
jgi:hypothetical protein